MSAVAAPKSAAGVWLPVVLDIAGPFLAWLVIRAFGGPAIWALAAGGLVAGATAAVNTIRRKGLDVVGGLVLLELAASIVILLTVRDPRLMLARPSLYTGIAAVYLIGSVLFGRPLTYEGAKPMATKGDPARLALYEHAWETSRPFRMTHRLLTFGLGVALAADSVLRVVIVFNAPLQRSAWLSNLPHLGAIALFLACSALAGRRFKRLVQAAAQ